MEIFPQDEISETFCDFAFKRLYSRLSISNNTSYKITAKIVLIAIGEMKKKKIYIIKQSQE